MYVIRSKPSDFGEIPQIFFPSLSINNEWLEWMKRVICELTLLRTRTLGQLVKSAAIHAVRKYTRKSGPRGFETNSNSRLESFGARRWALDWQGSEESEREREVRAGRAWCPDRIARNSCDFANWFASVNFYLELLLFRVAISTFS